MLDKFRVQKQKAQGKHVPAGKAYDYFEGSEVQRAARTQYVCPGLVNTVNIPDDPAAD